MLSLEVSSHSRTQILEGLGFNLMQVSEFDSHQGFQNLLHTLHLPGNSLETCVGNALFLSPEQLLLLRYLKDSAIFYESRLFCTNFKDCEHNPANQPLPYGGNSGEDCEFGQQAQCRYYDDAGELCVLQRSVCW